MREDESVTVFARTHVAREGTMALTSEQFHWIFGGFVASLGVVLFAAELSLLRHRAIGFALPVGLIIGGAMAAADPLLHGSTSNANPTETAQHIAFGIGMLAVGVIELQRARQRLARVAWSLALPLFLVAVGIAFLRHAQHEAAAPPLVLIVQHRLQGIALITAGLAKAVVEIRGERAGSVRGAWLVALIIFGLEFLVYTESGGAAGHGAARPPANEHEGH